VEITYQESYIRLQLHIYWYVLSRSHPRESDTFIWPRDPFSVSANAGAMKCIDCADLSVRSVSRSLTQTIHDDDGQVSTWTCTLTDLSVQNFLIRPCIPNIHRKNGVAPDLFDFGCGSFARRCFCCRDHCQQPQTRGQEKQVPQKFQQILQEM
jgi:hypothetical protein